MDPSTLKILQGAAGAAGDSAIGVEDVFKTYVYTGNATARSINTGIDMTKGGMVWFKDRDDVSYHMIFDTERGATKAFVANEADDEADESQGLTAFNNNGFSIGTGDRYNKNNDGICSWSFRKQKKFFDVVTYTGNDANNRQIAHGLGSTPGCIIIKMDFNNVDWYVWHRGLNGGTNSEEYSLKLNTNDNQADNDGMGDTLPTSTHFTVHDNSQTNADGFTYVAYLFAHDEAEFGPNSDQKIISCGYYSGTGAAQEINVGFEPQWILHKAIDAGTTEHWHIFDSMRGITTGGNDNILIPNATAVESYSNDFIEITPTGFKPKWHYDPFNGNGTNHIYIAIAAETGKTSKVPENGTDVFAMDTGNNSSTENWTSSFPVDFATHKKTNGNASWFVNARLIQGKELRANTSTSEVDDQYATFDSNTGFYTYQYGSDYQAWMWKRHAGFDVVTYTGNSESWSAATQNISHNLSVTPQMILIKNRDATQDWYVYHMGLRDTSGNHGSPETAYAILNSTAAENHNANIWNNTAPTSSVFSIGSHVHVNQNGQQFLALLFASVDGISKVGYFQSASTAQDLDLDLGFTPRFFIIKSITAGVSGPWYTFDTTRGIVSGNDPWLALNSSAAQDSTDDLVDPITDGIRLHSEGSPLYFNDPYRHFIYYAHA